MGGLYDAVMATMAWLGKAAMGGAAAWTLVAFVRWRSSWRQRLIDQFTEEPDFPGS